MKRILAAFTLLASTLGLGVSVAAQGPEHFDPKGKPASKYTAERNQALRESLPFGDRRDFEEFRRGFIAAPEDKRIQALAGGWAWDMQRYDFLNRAGAAYPSIHPSLLRQAQLNTNYGLYEVLEGRIYQVRGFDLSNVTFVRSDSGWIVFDTAAGQENAAAAYDLVSRELGQHPIVAVVHSHPHADHFGGVRALVEEADLRAGKVQIIVPEGFLEHAVSENVYAGAAMNRRLFYQYGILLDASPFGHVDQSIGKNLSAGRAGLLPPTREIGEPIEELTVDGVRMIFQNTPGTEAPAEMNTYFPEWKALWMAENVTNTVHNIYTLRGALVRDALAWSREINRALYLFGGEAEVMFASHSWPRWGNARIQEVLRIQRDIYANMNNQVLHRANLGATINTIHNEYRVPESLQQSWAARGYHGSIEHNVRAVWNRYLGYWDANPATLIPLSPADTAPLYVEMMGGSPKILARGRELHEAGEYKLAMEILDKLVHAEPDNRDAKDLLADVFEQIGYQQESPSVRNSFLNGAYELRNGINPGPSFKTAVPDVIRAMSTQLYFEYLGVRVDGDKAEGMAFTINVTSPDTGEKLVVEMSNATLTVLALFQAPEPDLTITMDRADVIDVMSGTRTLAQQVDAGRATLAGDAAVVERLRSTLVDFPGAFEVLPGTTRSR